jgi:hypothetical protein
MINASELLKQADEIERKQSEVSEYLSMTELNKERKAQDLQRLKDARSQLVSVYVNIKPNDKPNVEAALLPLLQARCEQFTIDDLRHRNKCQGGIRWEFKCHPEDFNEVVRISTEMYNRNFTLPPPPAVQAGNSVEFTDHLYSPMM